MAENTSRKQLMDLAFAALLSEDDAAVLTALARVEEQGDARAIMPLLAALSRTQKPVVQQRIMSLLYQVKAIGSVPVLIAALDDASLFPVRQVVLATFWNAGLDARDHLDRFIQIAIEGSTEECFECLTVIENQEIWPERAARLGLARVRKAADAESDDHKRAMLRDIASSLHARLGAIEN